MDHFIGGKTLTEKQNLVKELGENLTNSLNRFQRIQEKLNRGVITDKTNVNLSEQLEEGKLLLHIKKTLHLLQNARRDVVSEPVLNNPAAQYEVVDFPVDPPTTTFNFGTQNPGFLNMPSFSTNVPSSASTFIPPPLTRAGSIPPNRRQDLPDLTVPGNDRRSLVSSTNAMLPEFRRSISSDLFKRSDFGSVVSGLKLQPISNATETKHSGGYSVNTWSIGFDEIVFDPEPICVNRFGIECRKIRVRGKDAYGKVVSPKLLAEKFASEDKYKFFEDESLFQMVNPSGDTLAAWYGVCTEENHLVFVREWFPHGSLQDIMFGNGTKFKLSFWRKMNIAQTVAEAMYTMLSAKGFTNPNVRLSNILFTELWDAKLADQGFRAFFERLKKDELKPVDETSLIKEFGTLLWTLITELDGFAFKGRQPSNVGVPKCPDRLRDLIQNCFSNDAQVRPRFESIINTNVFEEIFYEASINGANQFNAMWEEVAKGFGTVTWNTFLPAFCKAFEIVYDEATTGDTLEFQCLKYMLECDTKPNVTLEAFERLLKCLGPFLEGSEIIDQVKHLLQMPWFMGPLSAIDAEAMLQPLPARSFLVRFSSSTGEFSITFKQKGKVLHSRVPTNAKYNLHQYVNLLIQKKKFRVPQTSRYSHLFASKKNGYHSWTYIR